MTAGKFVTELSALCSKIPVGIDKKLRDKLQLIVGKLQQQAINCINIGSISTCLSGGATPVAARHPSSTPRRTMTEVARRGLRSQKCDVRRCSVKKSGCALGDRRPLGTLKCRARGNMCRNWWDWAPCIWMAVIHFIKMAGNYSHQHLTCFCTLAPHLIVSSGGWLILS